MADLVVRATLRDHVLPQLARMAAGMQALEKQMEASSKRTNATIERNAKKTQQEVFKIDNAMRGTARRMASRVLLIGAAIAAAAGHAVALTAALWPMIGALGAIPAITVGGIAGIAALVMGFSGLGAAMKKTGGGAGASASQITSAQRRIEMANRSLRDSQESLNDAWEEARDQLRDIQTQYAGAQLDVEGAALAVRDAELALREARSSGDRQERARADLALRQARLNQIEVANRLSDVEQEYHERLAKGVEGSDEVRDAQERQADAVYELAEAQKALNEALKGGGGGGGGDDAYAKLSASGRKLVDTLKALGPEWRKVQQATQEALFAGVAEHVQALSDKFLPVMMRQLPGLAQGWNNMFIAIAGVAERADRVQDIDESLGLMAVMWQRVGNSFGPFFEGFLDWVRVGADFMPRLGSWIERQADRWRRWSAEVRATGKAAGWIENALVTGHKFNELIKSWSRSLFEVFRLGQDKTLLDRLVAGSEAFERWLKTAEGQERITNMWERMRDLGSAAWRVITEVIDILSQFDFSALATILNVVADAFGVVADNMGLVNAVVGPLIQAYALFKTATIVLATAKGALTGASRLLGIQLMTETGIFEKNTAAQAGNATAGSKLRSVAGRLERALGPLALAYVAVDVALGDWLDDLLKINQVKTGHLDALAAAGYENADAFVQAREAGEQYLDWLSGLTNPLKRFENAQDDVNEAQQNVNDALADFGDDSPEYQQAVLDLAAAKSEYAAAAEDAAGATDLSDEALMRIYQDMGLTAQEAQVLIDKTHEARGAWAAMDGARARMYVEIVTTGAANILGELRSKLHAAFPMIFHKGGIVPGARGQEVAAVLEAGEQVIPVDQVGKRGGTAGGPMELHVFLHTNGPEIVKAVRYEVRKRAGKASNSVQVALG